MSKAKEVFINIDGASSGNPGDSAVGILIRDINNQEVGKISKYIGIGTNNAAEYTALVIALEQAYKLGAERLHIKSDSELLVKQMKKEYKVKNDNLKELNQKAKDLFKNFAYIDIEHIKREFNKEADYLAKKAIEEHQKADRTVAVCVLRNTEESPSSKGQRSG